MHASLVFVATGTILLGILVQATCPCAANDDQCVIEEWFKALQIWPDDADRCGPEGRKFDVKAWRKPFPLDASQFRNIDNCFLNPAPKLFIETSSTTGCGPFRCCAMCSDCFSKLYDVLPDEVVTQTLMKSKPRLLGAYDDAARIYMWCAPSDSTSLVGYQDFFLTLDKSKECKNDNDD